MANMNDGKMLATTCQWRADGETIPFTAVGGEKVGDIVVVQASIGRIAIVQALTHELKSEAVAGEVIQIRTDGAVAGPMTAADVAAGARVEWNGSAFAANPTTGEHIMLDDYVDADHHYGVVRMNVAPS